VEPHHVRREPGGPTRRDRFVARRDPLVAIGRQLPAWALIVGTRGDDVHQRLAQHLAPSARRWASSASALLANLAHRRVAGTDWDYSEFSSYDLGQAVAHMTVQARSLGLHVRQFRAFDREAIAAAFGVPAHWEVTTKSAVGSVPSAFEGAGPSADRERERRSLQSLRWPTPATAWR
jgi:hypothetical protein